jgi:hypothetical protein
LIIGTTLEHGIQALRNLLSERRVPIVNTRRKFLAKVAAAAATVAVAPSLALPTKTYWTQDRCHSRSFDDEYMCVMSNKPTVLQSEQWKQTWWFDLKVRRLPDGTYKEYYDISPTNFDQV